MTINKDRETNNSVLEVSTSSTEEQHSLFAKEVGEGLSLPTKKLSSKYFYDDIGSQIFQQIMDMPEYYLTRAEWEILSKQGSEIFWDLQFSGAFNVVELGAGDGIKTLELLKHFVHLAGEDHVVYKPIDISQEAIDTVTQNVTKQLSNISLEPWVGDYSSMWDTHAMDKPNLFLFLGSNIGNFSHSHAVSFLKKMYAQMKVGDKLLLGMDLQKNPHRISQAYNDPHGITATFNLNLLHRINRELDGNFKVEQFDFYCYYNPNTGDVRSHLVSLEKQEVFIGALGQGFSFEKNELIHTELSKKYSFREIETLAKEVGFSVEKHFLDSQKDFVDTLWSK